MKSEARAGAWPLTSVSDTPDGTGSHCASFCALRPDRSPPWSCCEPFHRRITVMYMWIYMVSSTNEQFGLNRTAEARWKEKRKCARQAFGRPECVYIDTCKKSGRKRRLWGAVFGCPFHRTPSRGSRRFKLFLRSCAQALNRFEPLRAGCYLTFFRTEGLYSAESVSSVTGLTLLE